MSLSYRAFKYLDDLLAWIGCQLFAMSLQSTSSLLHRSSTASSANCVQGMAGCSALLR